MRVSTIAAVSAGAFRGLLAAYLVVLTVQGIHEGVIAPRGERFYWLLGLVVAASVAHTVILRWFEPPPERPSIATNVLAVSAVALGASLLAWKPLRAEPFMRWLLVAFLVTATGLAIWQIIHNHSHRLPNERGPQRAGKRRRDQALRPNEPPWPRLRCPECRWVSRPPPGEAVRCPQCDCIFVASSKKVKPV